MQLAHQLEPKTLVEETQKSDQSRKLKGMTKFTFGKLFELLGISNETSGELESAKIRATEQKFMVSEDATTNSICNFLSKSTSHIRIDDNFKFDNQDIDGLIRVCGSFRPVVLGQDYLERLSNYEKSDTLKWIGKCGNLNIIFYTGKSSIISNTPIHPLLDNPEFEIKMDGFNTFHSMNDDILQVTPLFLGMEISEK